MQTPKINFVSASSVFQIGNTVEKVASKVAEEASKAVKPAEQAVKEIPIKEISNLFAPQMSYALSHGCVPNEEVGKNLFKFV